MVSNTTLGSFFKRPLVDGRKLVVTTASQVDLANNVNATRVSIQNIDGPTIWINLTTAAVDNGYALETGDMLTLNWENVSLDNVKLRAQTADGNVYIIEEGL
jgi:hypothetical protein